MEHTESRIKVFFTKDYDRFAKLRGNRQLNTGKINRIKKDILEEGLDMLRYCPILVHDKNGQLEVIDGQHRLAVARQLNSPVWYILADELTLAEIAKVNSRTEKWKTQDFVNCYVEQGNEHYAILRSFQEQYQFPYNVCARLLACGNLLTDSGVANKDGFESGKFEVKEEASARAVSDKVIMFSSFPGHKSRAFIVAICKIIDAGKVKVDDVAAAYAANKDMLILQTSYKAYLQNLETIMNKGKHTRVTIY
ncbi:ParB/Sulfiredoxin [uncultured Caudovirales phage]|uniref:ParB/Sulfiredoxin n=1 Tax=uncultured Caudovirales phage TaxID=2100421 RepID=A0A6J5KVL7_9CAUD|nr:ParB/Sulfiredoxin [uncultured Caudovirales phage]